MSEDFTQRATCECYYKFENSGSLGDDEQGQIALTPTNSPTQSADIPDDAQTYCGVSATKSVELEADSSQYLVAAHDDSLEIDDLTAFTCLGWFKFESTANQALFYKSSYDADGFWFRTKDALDDLYARFDDAIGYRDVAMSTAVWYFLAMTYDQTQDAIRLFLGTETAQVAQVGTDIAAVDKTGDTTRDFCIGRRSTNADYYGDYKATECSILSEALSLAKLQEIQADGMEGTPVVEVPTPVLSKDGIHSLVFGGQVISG